MMCANGYDDGGGRPSPDLDPDSAPPSGARLSFLIWLAEVPDIAAEAALLSIRRAEPHLAVRLQEELDRSCAEARKRQIPRKAFRFAPSVEVAELAKLAIEGARREPSPRLPPKDA